MSEGINTINNDRIDWNAFLVDNKIKVNNNDELLAKLNGINKHDLFKINNIRKYAKESLNIKGVLEVNRFAKGILNMKAKEGSNDTAVATRVIVSMKEHNAMVKLQNRYDKCVNLEGNIKTNGFDSLQNCADNCVNVIANEVDNIVKMLNKKNQLLMKDIDKIARDKEKSLKKQLKQLKVYESELLNGCLKYGNNKQSYGRNVIKNINKILDSHNGSTNLLTKPEIKFKLNDDNVDLHMNNMFNINEFDKPFPPRILISKIDYGKTKVRLMIGSLFKNETREVTKYSIEYAAVNSLAKFDKTKINDSHNDVQSDNDDKTDSDSDSNNSKTDSDSTISDHANDSNELEYFEINTNVNDDLHWKHKKVDITSKMMRKNLFECSLSTLKPNTYYILKGKVKNKYGWSTDSKVIGFKTLKMGKEMDIELECVKGRKYYSNYVPSKLLQQNGEIYASPTNNDNWKGQESDPVSIILS